MSFDLHLGDCRDVLAAMAPDSVDSIVTDPPYGLSFMGKGWDHGVPGEEFWREALRVAKPGAILLAFGGTRTFHRLVCGIEDAGWEIRDQLGWLYGSGFPKSHNLQGDRKGWGTALKPAFEPICMARKPFRGTVAENVDRHGTGALNIDGCRVGTSKQVPASRSKKAPSAVQFCSGKPDPEGCGGFDPNLGRWPANILHDGSAEVLAVFPDSAGANSTGTNGTAQKAYSANGWIYDGGIGKNHTPFDFMDSGSAARFFYCAKASGEDREANNTHPTVKPHDLMRYLCRIVTPPGGTVLDPFMGSGSTGKAAVREGFRFVGIDLEPEYLAIAEARIRAAAAQGRLDL